MSAVRIPINVHKFTTAGEVLFDVLNIDFIGPFPDGTHVLVIVDSFSRWTELFHCKDSTAESACRCLLEHFGRFGSPNLIRSDRGPHFANDLIEKIFADLIGSAVDWGECLIWVSCCSAAVILGAVALCVEMPEDDGDDTALLSGTSNVG